MRLFLSWSSVACCLGVFSACGGVAEPGVVGGSNNSGGTSSGGSNSGGMSAGGASAGAGPTGGVSGGTGGTAGLGGSASCPTVSIAKIFPVVGPFFMGPDPGPCSQTQNGVTSTYAYEGDLVASSTIDGGETYERDEMGRMTRYVTSEGGSEQTYAPGFLYDTTETFVVTYSLNADGYPTEGAEDADVDGETDNLWRYIYEDCRLTRRLAPEGNPNFTDRIYEYDDVGHVIAVRDGTRVITFDYSCWAP